MSNSLYRLQPLTLGGIATYSLSSRKSKVSVYDFARPLAKNASITKFLSSLPNILACSDLHSIIAAIQRAKLVRHYSLGHGRPRYKQVWAHNR